MGVTEELSNGDLFAALTESTLPHRKFPFPRKFLGKEIMEVAIVPLTQAESMVCQKAAETFVRKELGEHLAKETDAKEGYLNLYRNAAAVEIVHRACRDVRDVSKPVFQSPSVVRKLLTPDEVGILMNYYNRVQLELGPIVVAMTPEEMDAWIARLEEGGQEHFLDWFSSEAKNDLIKHLVSKQSSSPTGNGSSGSHADEPTSELLDAPLPETVEDEGLSASASS